MNRAKGLRLLETGSGEKAADTKMHLATTALTLFVANGIAATTTRQIAMAAGIAEGTIYRHYPSKEALALELFRDRHIALAADLRRVTQLSGTFRDKLRAAVGCYCQFADSDWTGFAYYHLNMHTFLPLLAEGTPNPVDALVEIAASASTNGDIITKDPEFAAAMAIGTILQPAVQKIYGRLDFRFADRAEDFLQAIERLLAGPGKA